MTFNLTQSIMNEAQSINMMIVALTAIIHIVFASAVAKDAGQLHKRNQTTILVSGIVWAFATLVGGVFVAVGYWFVHYSSLMRR